MLRRCHGIAPSATTTAGAVHTIHNFKPAQHHVVFQNTRRHHPRTPVAVAVALSQFTRSSSASSSSSGSDADDGDALELLDWEGCRAALYTGVEQEHAHAQPLEATACGIRFQLHFHSRPGQEVVVTGSDPAIGSWDVLEGLKLRWQEGNVWTNEEPVQLAAGQPLEYKYVVLSTQRPQQLWSTGENLRLEVPQMGGTWTLQDTWQLPSNSVVQEGMAPEACLAAAAASAVATASGNNVFEEAPPLPDSEAAAPCEHAVGSEYPVAIKYKCFLCGQCMQPHLHERTCPRGYSDADVERIFEDAMGRGAGGAAGSLGSH